MARTLADLPAGSRITDYISLGVIAKSFPVEKIAVTLCQWLGKSPASASRASPNTVHLTTFP